MTGLRVVEHPVLDPVDKIALRHDGLAHELLQCRRNHGNRKIIRVRVHRLVDVRVASSELYGPVVRRSAGDDGVEVVDGKIISASQGDNSLHVMVDGVDRQAVKLRGSPADIGIDTKRMHIAVPYVGRDRVDIVVLEPQP